MLWFLGNIVYKSLIKTRRQITCPKLKKHDNEATLCGADGTKPTFLTTIELARAERLCDDALSQPDRDAAIRLLTNALPAQGTKLPESTNEAVISLYALLHGEHQSDTWQNACWRAENAKGKSGRYLLTALEFKRPLPCEDTVVCQTTIPRQSAYVLRKA